MKTTTTILIAIMLTSCMSQKLVMGKVVKKEPQVYWGGVAFLGVSTIVLMSIKFKTE